MTDNIGHNRDHLKQIAGGIKKLMEDADRIKEDIAERYAEAKDAGYDIASIKKVISEQRKFDKQPEKYKEQRDLFDFMAEVIAPELNK